MITSNSLVALGSNLSFMGERPEAVLRDALRSLESRGYVIRIASRFFGTPAFPAGSGPDFVNAAVALSSPYSAPEILQHLHDIEAEAGRERTQRWGARTLDLDLIAVDAQVLPDAQTHQYWRELPLEVQKSRAPQDLILPHPRLAERAFVLVPLMDVAPDWVHPVTGHSVDAMCAALPQALRAQVIAL